MDRARLVLGTLSLSHLPHPERERILDHFVDWGGVWVDTAGVYGGGDIERFLGTYRRRKNVRISTKIGYFEKRETFVRRDLLLQSLQRQVERLGGWPDQLLMHEADWPVWWNSENVDFSPQVLQSSEGWHVLRALAAEKGIRVGISGNNAKVLDRLSTLLNPDVVLVAKQYDLIWRSAQDLVNRSDSTLELWLASPFHQGWLFRLVELAKCRNELRPFAQRLETILPSDTRGKVQLALAWIKAAAPNAHIVAGVSSYRELTELLDAWNAPVSRIFSEALSDGYHGPSMAGPLPSLAWQH